MQPQPPSQSQGATNEKPEAAGDRHGRMLPHLLEQLRGAHARRAARGLNQQRHGGRLEQQPQLGLGARGRRGREKGVKERVSGRVREGQGGTALPWRDARRRWRARPGP